ncbi:MAG: choice-of-anchor D domain-containing protein, partial [Myxococcota bacterium]
MNAKLGSALLALLTLVGCESCDSVGLTEVSPRLVVEPSPLALGDVVAGVRVQANLTVRNDGDANLTLTDVSLESEPGGFELIPGFETALAPSQSTVVQVALDRESLGFAEAILLFASNDPERPELRVRITATIVDPPPCDDGNVCTRDVFDPDANACTHPFVDGVPCESADRCIVDAVCSQGVCLGSSKTCEDNNPCTSNFCRQTDGMCLFLEEEDLCDDDNPCTADSCSPEGCVHEPVPSGVACDDGDLCTVGDACFQGRCTGAGLADGTACDDGDSCTIGDTCSQGVCAGQSIVTAAPEGSVVFTYPLQAWPDRAFLHRREVSLGDSGVFYGLDHLNLPEGEGLAHVLFAMEQCGSTPYRFTYRPPDANVLVSFVRRGVQVDRQDGLRLIVGVRQRPQDGYRPQTTAYVLDAAGEVQLSQIQRLGGETGRSLLPDGSEVFGVIFPLTEGPPTAEQPALQNLVIVREDVSGAPLWRHERASDDWAEFLGVAGPRVLFWARGRFGA